MSLRLVLYLTASMTLVTAIVALAMLWVHLSHLKRLDGPLLVGLWSTHGVHAGDVLFFVAEVMLVTILTGTLVAGFSRGR